MWVLLIYIYGTYGIFNAEIHTQSFKTESACLNAKRFYDKISESMDTKIITTCISDGIK